jgi:hypothetical protein
MKQETLEEAILERKFKSNYIFSPDSFLEGVKWQQEQSESHFESKGWAEVNSTLLVNFLKMPEEHKIHLLASIKERRPDLFECKLETEAEAEK